MASAGHLTPAADQRESERARFANILLSGLQSGRMDEVIQQTKQGNTGKMQAAQVKEIKEQATSSLLEALNSGKFDAAAEGADEAAAPAMPTPLPSTPASELAPLELPAATGASHEQISPDNSVRSPPAEDAEAPAPEPQAEVPAPAPKAETPEE